MLSFNYAAHNKPSLIRNILPKYMPVVYSEARVKVILCVRVVIFDTFPFAPEGKFFCRAKSILVSLSAVKRNG